MAYVMMTLRRGHTLPARAYFIRGLSAKGKLNPKFDFKLDEEVKESVTSGELLARKHPGAFRGGTVVLPSHLTEAASTILTNYSKKAVERDAKSLFQYLLGRHAPLEVEEYQDKVKEVTQKIIQTEPVDPFSPEVPDEVRRSMLDSRTSRVHERLKRELYNWKALQYDKYMSIVYMAACLAPNYACMAKILAEIQKRDTCFSPKTVLDFGSGVGSSLWAVDAVWPDQCKEAVYTDASADMNAVADQLLRGGDPEEPRVTRPGGTFFKQFLPLSSTLKYNIVISSHSLFELPNITSRLQVVDVLWRKTTDYLVIVEAGTNAGYKLVQEARDYVLALSKQESKENDADLDGYVFSPCPHDKFCPKYLDGTNIPCNFEISYKPLIKHKNQDSKKYVYTYVVLKRGRRSNQRVEDQWPRVVQSPLQRKGHVICRLCTKFGTLQELTATKRRHGKECYKISKNTKWGDLLPVYLTDPDLPAEDETTE